MKKVRRFCVVAALGCVALGMLCGMTQVAVADIIMSHVGSTDPTSEGWTWYDTGSITTGVASIATASWEVTDAATDARGYYIAGLDSTTASLLSSEGFRLDVEACVPGVSQTVEGAAVVSVTLEDRDKYFDIFLGSDENGNALVKLGASTTSYAIGSGGFHSYSMIFDPEDAEVSLYVDGVFKGTDTGRSFSLGSSMIRFGSSNTPATGSGYYSLVELSAVPEPSFVVLLLGMGGFLLVWKRRR